MPGPAPKNPMQRRRTNSAPTFRILPWEGLPGIAPLWPLATKPTSRQATRYQVLWNSPQAFAWQDLGDVAPAVAMYVLMETASQDPDASASIRNQYLQLSDRLGLNPRAMKSLGWHCEPTEDVANEKPPIKLVDYRKNL
jgi:hypothetical protein